MRGIHGLSGIIAIVLLTTRPAVAADGPSNGWLVWASDRNGGRREVYIVRGDGSGDGFSQLTTEGGEFPAWSPDGRWIAYTHSAGTTHVIRHDGSEDKQVCGTPFKFWMNDGSGLVCGDSDQGKTYERVNPDAGSPKLLFKQNDFAALEGIDFSPGGITHDGKWLLGWSSRYRQTFTGDNGTFKSHNTAIILNRDDPAKVYFFGGGCEPTTPPSGEYVYHVCGDETVCAKPDIYRMRLSDIDKTPPEAGSTGLSDVTKRTWYQAEVSNEDADWGHEYFPRISNDNKWLAYGATTGCHDHVTCDYEIFVHKLDAGPTSRLRITNHEGNDSWPDLFVGELPKLDCTDVGDCDDQNPCTTDSCEARACSNVPIAGCCTNSADCDGGDQCTNNRCEHSDASVDDTSTTDSSLMEATVPDIVGSKLQGGCEVGGLCPTSLTGLLLLLGLFAARRRP